MTIETASRAEAELIAQHLPVPTEAESWRGYGVIRLGPRKAGELHAVIQAVTRGFNEHALRWTRVRYGDEELVLRINGQRAG